MFRTQVDSSEAGSETWIVGGGAYHAEDKIVQHNGCGTVNIVNFYAKCVSALFSPSHVRPCSGR